MKGGGAAAVRRALRDGPTAVRVLERRDRELCWTSGDLRRRRTTTLIWDWRVSDQRRWRSLCDNGNGCYLVAAVAVVGAAAMAGWCSDRDKAMNGGTDLFARLREVMAGERRRTGDGGAGCKRSDATGDREGSVGDDSSGATLVMMQRDDDGDAKSDGQPVEIGMQSGVM
ncbi:hypothetical protein Scep_017405 [Stephania cephalantha]|uniref:Uncharacterized protein n=1 Tax=Stephania cephalantha TaxID=152367 RepID=A0AAP0IRB7_9MAGN